MTIKEAINELYNTETDDEDLEEAINMAIEALEKQIPKKPINQKKLADLRIGFCPICNSPTNPGFVYCVRCGQKLDWSKE